MKFSLCLILRAYNDRATRTKAESKLIQISPRCSGSRHYSRGASGAATMPGTRSESAGRGCADERPRGAGGRLAGRAHEPGTGGGRALPRLAQNRHLLTLNFPDFPNYIGKSWEIMDIHFFLRF